MLSLPFWSESYHPFIQALCCYSRDPKKMERRSFSMHAVQQGRIMDALPTFHSAFGKPKRFLHHSSITRNVPCSLWASRFLNNIIVPHFLNQDIESSDAIGRIWLFYRTSLPKRKLLIFCCDCGMPVGHDDSHESHVKVEGNKGYLLHHPSMVSSSAKQAN